MQNNDTALFVSPGPDLNNPASGEGTRLRNLSLELSEYGWQVFTLVPEETDDTTPDWVTKQYRYRQWSLPHLTDVNPFFVSTLRRVLSREDIDIIHLSTGVCTAKLLTLVDSDTTVVYAAQNVEADHAKDFVDPDLPVYKRLLGPWLIPLIEWATVRCANGITTVSNKDKKRFVNRHGLSGDKIKIIPTGTTAVSRSKLADPSDIREHLDINSNQVAVFHGDYTHPPNLEAARLIDRRIAPMMKEHNIDLSFILIGNNPPNVSSPNVHTTGFVEDILSVLNVADVAVVPILHGGGTKTKIYDYISLALPIVATKKAVEGIDLTDGVHACITKYSDEGIISCMLKLLRDEQRYLTMQQNLNDLSEEWTWKQSVGRLDDGYHEMQNR